MEVYEITEKTCLAPLFDGWDAAMPQACLQNHMGQAFGDDLAHPRAGQILVGDFCFFAGTPHAALVRNLPKDKFCILVFRGDDWAALSTQIYGAKLVPHRRYAFSQPPAGFDTELLTAFAAQLPQGYGLSPIDDTLYEQITGLPWAKDLCGQFRDRADYATRGIGVAAVRQSEVMAGASSYTVYTGGIEVEIDTREDQRRQGLARACGAQLILNCLAKGLVPSWDAHNEASAALAAKLGYLPAGSYVSYIYTP